jgi:hypothetical protein
MSQKSSLPQAASSVSQVLKRDNSQLKNQKFQERLKDTHDVRLPSTGRTRSKRRRGFFGMGWMKGDRAKPTALIQFGTQ